MIRGVVTAQREAKMGIQVQGAAGQTVDTDAILDTGFTGYLTLPMSTITTLALHLHGAREAVLGDGSRVTLDIYRGAVIWDNQIRSVQVLAAEGDSLIGMSLLYGYEVRLQVVDGGQVEIERLP